MYDHVHPNLLMVKNFFEETVLNLAVTKEIADDLDPLSFRTSAVTVML